MRLSLQVASSIAVRNFALVFVAVVLLIGVLLIKYNHLKRWITLHQEVTSFIVAFAGLAIFIVLFVRFCWEKHD
jgi:hypothetical protein